MSWSREPGLSLTDQLGHRVHRKPLVALVVGSLLLTSLSISALQQVLGWGGMLSAAARVYGKDNIVFQVAGGEGIARYILDLGSGSGLTQE
jgi:hypothetical protein